MATTTTPYLAPALKDQGYTGVTGTTPYKPPTDAQLGALKDAYYNSPNAPYVISTNAVVINVNLDGTQNNGAYPKPGESPTNVYRLWRLQNEANPDTKENNLYYPGVGAQKVDSDTKLENGAPAPGSSPSNWESTPIKAGAIANEIVQRAYVDVVKRVEAILDANPNAEISINLSGFSRGGVQDFALANLIDKRGIPRLFEPGRTVIDTMTVFDPVDQTGGALDASWPTNVKSNLVFVSTGESRNLFPAAPLGADANVIPLDINHAGNGGSFNPQGTSSVSLGLAQRFQSDSGMKIADVPANLQPDWGQMYIYNSGLDNYGNTIFDFDQSGKRYYQGAGLGAPSVQEVLRNGPPHAATPPNASAGDAMDYKVSVNPAKPDGPQLTVTEVTDRAGNSSITVRNEHGDVVLTTQAGEIMIRDPETGALTVTRDGLETRSYSPSTGVGVDLGPDGSDAHFLHYSDRKSVV